MEAVRDWKPIDEALREDRGCTLAQARRELPVAEARRLHGVLAQISSADAPATLEVRNLEWAAVRMVEAVSDPGRSKSVSAIGGSGSEEGSGFDDAVTWLDDVAVSCRDLRRDLRRGADPKTVVRWETECFQGASRLLSEKPVEP